MNPAFHAKAIAAFAVSLAVPPVLLAATSGETRHILAAAMLGLATAVPTALAVWWVPNRTHGFNVNDIAAVLIRAGFDAVEQDEDITHEHQGEGAAPDQG